MLLTFDLDTCQLIQAPGYLTPLEKLAAKRGDGEHLQLQFCRDGMLVQLPGSSQIKLGVKKWGDYDGDAMAESGAMAWDSVLQRYEGSINYNTTGLNSMLLIGASGEADEDGSTDDLMLEVLHRPSDAVTWTRSINTVRLILHNNVWRGDESPATGGTGTEILTSDYLTKDRVIEYLPLCTGLTGGGVSNLDGLTTTSAVRSLNSAVALIDNTSGVDMLRVYELVSASTAESAPSVIRPDDYHATTNARVWRLRTSSAHYDPALALTKAESLEWLVYVRGTTGGGSTKLDGIATAGGAKPINSLVAFSDTFASGDDGGMLRIYELVVSTAAELPPLTIRPDDFHSTTNQRVWFLRSAPNKYLAARHWPMVKSVGAATDGLTGGGAGSVTSAPTLDGIVTADGAVPLGTLVMAQKDLGEVGTLAVYKLVSGSDAEDSPDIIRPNDYNASTNLRVWKRQNFFAAPEIVSVPATTGASGRQGQIAFNSTHLYVCTSTNTWRRCALSTW